MRGKFVVLVISSLCLCSCQRRQKITIYMPPDSGQDVTEGLHIENGDYQAALNRCQEKVRQLNENSVEIADVYSLMGILYAEYVGNREQAAHYLGQAMAIHQKANDEIGLAQDYEGMSEISVQIDGNGSRRRLDVGRLVSGKGRL